MYSRTILITMTFESLTCFLFLFCYFLVFSISKFLLLRILWSSVPKPSAGHVIMQFVKRMWEGWGYWVFRWSSGMNVLKCWPVPAATTSLQWNQYNCPLKGGQQTRFLKTIKLENAIKVDKFRLTKLANKAEEGQGSNNCGGTVKQRGGWCLSI